MNKNYKVVALKSRLLRLQTIISSQYGYFGIAEYGNAVSQDNI